MPSKYLIVKAQIDADLTSLIKLIVITDRNAHLVPYLISVQVG